MRFLSRLFQAEKRDVQPLSVSVSNEWGMRQIFSPDRSSGAEYLAVTERCRSLISQNTASVPLVVYRTEGSGPVEDPGHPLFRILNDESSEGVSSFALRAALARDAATYGNGLAQIVRNSRGDVDELIYWPWRRVAVELLENNRLRYRVTDHNGRSRILLRSEVVHLKYETQDGILGVSPLDWARTSKEIVTTQAGLAREQAERGLVPDIVWETENALTGEMGDAAFQSLKQQLREAVQGLRYGRSIVTEYGLKAKTLATSSREAQFFEVYKNGLEDVARAHGIPLSAAGLGSHTSYGSLTEESRSLLRDCIGPWAVRIAQEFAISLLSREDRTTISLEHDLSGLERGDLHARMQAYKIGIETETFTPNEVRRWEGLPTREGGDTFSRPAVSQPPASNE